MFGHLLTVLPVFVSLCVAGLANGQLIIAHRGASYDAPENTLAAFQLAWRQGADGIEGDFFLTRDGQVICIHDSSTKRTAGVDLAVAETTLDELRRLDVGAWKDPLFTGERIPTLAEVLETIPAGKLFFVELKIGPEIVPPVKKILEASQVDAKQLVIISFNERTIAAAKEQMPDIRAHWLTSYKTPGPGEPPGPTRPTVQEIVETLQSTRADGLGTQANRDVVTPQFIRQLAEGGMKEFHVWTVNDAGASRYFQSLGAYSITTDRPGDMREWLEGGKD